MCTYLQQVAHIDFCKLHKVLAQFNVLQILIEEQTAVKQQIIIISWHVALLASYISYLETPIFPNVRVRDISGLMHTRSLRWAGWRIQSSQKLEQLMNH